MKVKTAPSVRQMGTLMGSRAQHSANGAFAYRLADATHKTASSE